MYVLNGQLFSNLVTQWKFNILNFKCVYLYSEPQNSNGGGGGGGGVQRGYHTFNTQTISFHTPEYQIIVISNSNTNL